MVVGALLASPKVLVQHHLVSPLPVYTRDGGGVDGGEERDTRDCFLVSKVGEIKSDGVFTLASTVFNLPSLSSLTA